MGRLLSLGHGETRFRVTGSMDSPAPAQDIVGAMEETEDPVSKVSSLGTRGTACAQGHRDRAWCLVECGSLTHAFGREQSFTHGVGSPQPSYSTPGPAAEHLNRRIRTRTYGGVGGRERQLSLRPDRYRLPVAGRIQAPDNPLYSRSYYEFLGVIPGTIERY